MGEKERGETEAASTCRRPEVADNVCVDNMLAYTELRGAQYFYHLTSRPAIDTMRKCVHSRLKLFYRIQRSNIVPLVLLFVYLDRPYVIDQKEV